MVQMDFNRLREQDLDGDLESGTNHLINEKEGSTSAGSGFVLNNVWNGFVSSNSSSESEGSVGLKAYSSSSDAQRMSGGLFTMEKKVVGGQKPTKKSNGYVSSTSSSDSEENVGLKTYSSSPNALRFSGEVSPLERKMAGGQKPKKKSSKKPPKPPRPPMAPLLDAADQKLVQEISELANLKRARIDRMKALKKMKNAKKSTSSNGSLFAVIITMLFCFVIVWQGLSSRGTSVASIQSSSKLSTGARGGFISVQFNKNVSANPNPSSASPNSSNVELKSGVDDHR